MPRAPKKTETAQTAPTAPTARRKPSRRGIATAASTITEREIARLAYELYEARGRTGGSPLDDWLHAEQLLKVGTQTHTD
jgi:hypothetical protein